MWIPRRSTSGRLRTHALRLVMALSGTALLAVAVGTTVAGSRAVALDDLDHALSTEATSHAGSLKEYFERAESIDLLLANDSVFRQFETGPRAGAGTQVEAASSQAGAAMAYLEELYPGRISEACLIDSTGTEIARVVRGVVAPPEDLSTEEASAPFFAPTMQLPRGRVYQSAPYLSPDTGVWVISNSTPMTDAAGRPWALVHFEVALDSFRPTLLRKDLSAAIVDTRTGRVLLETGRPLDASALGRPVSAQLEAVIRAGAGAGTVDGRRVAVARVPAQEDNANHWAVVVSAPATTLTWSESIGLAPVAMGLAAALLLSFAGLNLRASHRELRTASLTDDLTGLPNRRLLMDRLDQALLVGKRRKSTCAVMLVDLDRFKEVNDTLGHHHGDQLLRAVAVRLRETLRESDTVARLGGDEFAVLLPEVADQHAAEDLARRCVAALEDDFVIEGVTLHVEASAGLALGPQHGQDSNAVMRAADVAMYEAKTGNHEVVVYDPDLDVHTPTRLALLGDLRRALQADDQLVLHYQPKLDVGTDSVKGVEALVRWHHPQRGLVSPVDFVPAAEGTGLIMPLTLRTLDLAIGEARRWHDAGHAAQVAVNLSPRCLLELGFAGQVQDLLHQHQLPPHLLRLEITESTIMVDPARALTILSVLQQLGVALSIDDFGTGYSSMSYLKRLPVDELKIDRSFVMDMLADGSDAVLVRSSIELGHNLGLSVVAEGVEDEATLAALADLGCDVAQGYHLARPMDAAAMATWLQARQATSPQPAGAADR